MADKASVCVVSNDDDWSGFYVNGRLTAEGHSVSLHDALDALKGKTLTDFEFRTCNRDWLYDHGNLPDELEHVKWITP
jgi:hypothetical protein